MYSYIFDEETGGLLLTSSPLAFSKEPRPVYYKELDLLGFDKYWNYEKSDEYPYMWAESNNYYYRGKKVAQTKGGSYGNAPSITIITEPEPNGNPLRFVDIESMIEKNKKLLDGLIQETIKKTYNTYNKYRRKIDVFYVAFSGGKDSIVTFDIVQRALPHNSFKVLFGDTGMEFPDTYLEVDKLELKCKEEGIDFIRAKSEYDPMDTWKRFGPPATVARWCCSVHKTVPQILKLRKITGKPNFTGMAFVGIRASESLSRSEYKYISFGKKHKGQYSCNPILEWNSAELYLYIFYRNLPLSDAYKKGNRRAGCLVCPRASERNEYMAQLCYRNEFDKFINIVKDCYEDKFNDEKKLNNFIENGGWKARKNGRDLSIRIGYSEIEQNNDLVIKVENPKTDWKEWIKTIGILQNDTSPYLILFRDFQYSFSVDEFDGGYKVSIDGSLKKDAPVFIKLLKNVFRRAACCVNCHECEADCHDGCISMKNGNVKINEFCKHCAQCHKAEKGCLLYKSLEEPKGGLIMSSKLSLNRYSHHAPKIDWMRQYFEYKDDFAENNKLGSQMNKFFKVFLRDAELSDNNNFSSTAKVIDSIGLEEESSWAIMLVNLSYSPQINWFVKRLKMSEMNNRGYIENLLISDGTKESVVNDIINCFGRFCELPFSNVGMGEVEKKGRSVISITRRPWQSPNSKVVLYALYKFAEGCGDQL